MAGELRARDIRARLKGKVDPELMFCLEALAEQQHQLGKNQGSIVMLVDQMADITKNFVGVAENMKKVIDDSRKGNEDPDIGPVS